MPCLLILDRRAKRTVEAPDWVGRAYHGATPLGSGSYARVFGCLDGRALKLTNDSATMNLARRLALDPTPGFYRVLRLSRLRAPRPFMAVSMPVLRPLCGWRRAAVAAAYSKALVAAARSHGFLGTSARGARAFAQAMSDRVGEAPLSSFSASICRHLAASTIRNKQGIALRGALLSLAKFCQSHHCDIDLVGLDNWMMDDDGALVLSDPVVRKAYAF